MWVIMSCGSAPHPLGLLTPIPNSHAAHMATAQMHAGQGGPNLHILLSVQDSVEQHSRIMLPSSTSLATSRGHLGNHERASPQHRERGHGTHVLGRTQAAQQQ